MGRRQTKQNESSQSTPSTFVGPVAGPINNAAQPNLLQTRPFSTAPTTAVPQPEIAQSEIDQTQTSQTQTPHSQPTSSNFSFADVGILQPKMTVGTPNDPLEQEADTVARQVVNRIHGSAPTPPNGNPDAKPAVQRSPLNITRIPSEPQIPSPVQRPPLQRHGGIVSGEVNSGFESQISQTRGSGSPLQPQLRGQMESAMGANR